MKLFSSKRRIAAIVLLLLALFLIRPGASRLKSRIIRSISAGVGRPVDIGAVHVHLLPRPGFDLQNLVVYDDPSFSAEPILRANEVTAALRLTSLVRGRLEVARLELSEPSLNLVHREAGHWNLEALLERSARLPLAPTGKTKSEPRPAFPYIEATSGRINFKYGPEKKPYALTNADFSLWQESENTWGVRLKAQPFRTDMNLNDTGMLQVSGLWQRAETIRDTPLQLEIEWSHAQVGQLSKLITGNDQGWRGGLMLDISMKGTPAKLQISGTGSIEDFRRYDITSGKSLRMAAYCDAEYSSISHSFHGLMCNAPAGDGLITLTGELGFPGAHSYSLEMTAEKVPMGSVMMLAQRVKNNLPEDIEGEGNLRGTFSARENEGSPAQFDGRGEIVNLHLSSATTKTEFGPAAAPFVITSGLSSKVPAHKPDSRGPTTDAAGLRLEIGPLALSAAHAGTPLLLGCVDRHGYRFSVTGETDISRALRLARMIGLPALSTNAEGFAQVDLEIAGRWMNASGTSAGFAAPQITGNARLRNVHVALRGLGGPVEIASADLQFLPDALRVPRLNAKAAGTTWTGWVEMPRGCGTPDTCPVRFLMNTNRVALSDINEWLSPTEKRRWYQVLGSQSPSSLLGNLHATGRIGAEHLAIRGIDATHVSTNVVMQNGKLQLSEFSAALLEGTHQGEWRADFTLETPMCRGTGTLVGISLSALPNATTDRWIEGTGSAAYDLRGPCSADFWQSADGILRADIKDGMFPHLIIGERTEPLHFTRLSGQARIRGGDLEISNTTLTSADGIYEVGGNASVQQKLDVTLTSDSNNAHGAGYAIRGTLLEPHVSQMTATEQAHLKSVATK